MYAFIVVNYRGADVLTDHTGEGAVVMGLQKLIQ